MTCTVGVVRQDHIALASDHYWGNGNYYMRSDNEKVFRLSVYRSGDGRREMLVGTCGRPRLKQLLKHHFTPPEQDRYDQYYMTGPFVDAVKDLFDGQDVLKQSDDVAEVYNSSIIFGYGDSLYKMTGNFQMTEVQERYMAVGAGYQFALGALANMDRDCLSADTMAIRAVRAAECHSPKVVVEGPITREVIPVT